MSEVAQVYVPMMTTTFGVGNTLLYPWMGGYRHSQFGFSFKYLDLYIAKRTAAGK